MVRQWRHLAAEKTPSQPWRYVVAEEGYRAMAYGNHRAIGEIMRGMGMWRSAIAYLKMVTLSGIS